MKSYVDQMAWAIFGQRDYEIAFTKEKMFLIFETKEQADACLETIKHPANHWRVAPIRIFNGGFVPAEVSP